MITITRRLFTEDRIYRTLHQLTKSSVCHSHRYCVEKLDERGIVEVTGADASSFLQGLITNDIRHLDDGSKSMFTMFLNSKGCVLYDSIIHKVVDKFYVECDVAGVASLEKHLKMFKVRRKVDINVVDSLKVWSVFDPKQLDELKLNDEVKVVKDVGQERVVPCQGANVDQVLELDVKLANDLSDECLTMSNDPRLPSLGRRLIASNDVNVANIMEDHKIQVDDTLSYKLFRYMLGVGEGMKELPHSECFPLEVNCDYLHGVSFHKGCYIGQELTARIHHTGVVRKRLMPIYLDGNNCDIPFNTPIFIVGSGKQKRVGKLRGVENNTALGLTRISDALGVKLKVGDVTGYTLKPYWWPQEASKENQMSTRE
ncbi:hypothetical protein LSTR_LSTR002010 [Laodelphax striatellus]|uniref:CAF17 C-terminal domain-containing protein n=1 Tax=Laodelphax striatellus TaxID=195883 RepID=A0A482XHR4_LAOST|nr:hypothetical protein LSTR_LSTR002010 [Laodelphax striatellus]